MAKILYFTYDGLADPLGHSQILPYLTAAAVAGHQVQIISYEKSSRASDQLEKIESELRRFDIDWEYLIFRRSRFGPLKRVLAGVFCIRKCHKAFKADFVHLRGFIPAVIFQLSLVTAPSLYDFRGFALGEWVDMGKIKASSLMYRILKLLDGRAVQSASGIVVLEESAKRLLKNTYSVPSVPLKVIRTCTDITRYPKLTRVPLQLKRRFKFVFLGGVRYPYLPHLALLLVKRFLEFGVDGDITFINEADHAIIHKVSTAMEFPEDRLNVQSCSHSEVPGVLAMFDLGVVMIESSYWRKVCSPTKVGEYLAAGLPVVALDGIDMIDNLSNRVSCMITVGWEELEGRADNSWINRLLVMSESIDIRKKCRALAKTEFNIDDACNSYLELYDEMQKEDEVSNH